MKSMNSQFVEIKSILIRGFYFQNFSFLKIAIKKIPNVLKTFCHNNVKISHQKDVDLSFVSTVIQDASAQLGFLLPERVLERSTIFYTQCPFFWLISERL